MTKKITIVASSHRHESQSAHVAGYLESILQGIGADQTYVLSLSDNPLPLWDEGAWSEDPKWTTVWSPIIAKLKDSGGFDTVSPEWAGMVPAGLKNFFLLCGGDLLAHKPGLIVTVSASLGGSYPVVELRTSSYKNTRLCYIPDHVVIRNMGRMLKGDQLTDEHDSSLRQRIEYSLFSTPTRSKRCVPAMWAISRAFPTACKFAAA